ncbi:hypothetical protein CCR75_005638 [Bremia lactucae]|uniref:oligopeptidase A n=1 Tax=Bremia lactucae TaxID=4779 RepID=A0A976FN55_BRELC|nr:hypothetical protein CCR75_005638 [Bremia lactucae]
MLRLLPTLKRACNRRTVFQRSVFSTSTNLLEACVRARKLPPFERLQLIEIEPAVTNAAAKFRRDLHELETKLREIGNDVQFNDIVEPLETQSDALDRMWGIVGHLMSVRNSEELRAIHENLQQLVIETMTRASQSQTLYDAYKAVRGSSEWSNLALAQQRIIEQRLLDAKLSGVFLEGEAKEKFNKLKIRAAALSTTFSSNLLDATKAYSITITDRNELAGLPATLFQVFAHSARAHGHKDASATEGPWRITLDPPSYLEFMKYAANRSLRETLYRAYATRASGASFNNEPIATELLKIRHEIAQLLGFSSFAHMSMSSKMAPSIGAIDTMHCDLREKCIAIARDEVATVAEYAKQHGQTARLAPWDLSFWSDKLKAEQFQFTEDEIKPYFPLERATADGHAEVWHDSVRFYNVRRKTGSKKVIAQFFLDPYSRPEEKNGGAWMNTCLDRSYHLGPEDQQGLRIPVAYIICNQSPPVEKNTPSLMTFREVETMFHEFGHALQHMLTQMEYRDVAGINGIEWDAIELPSQMMENFCYDKDTMAAISGHYKTGEALPNELFEKLKSARKYMVATAMLRQLGFGALDMYLHSQYSATQEPLFDVQERLITDYSVVSPLKEDRFLCSFAHIFAGGYAASYYSYKWAEILSCDAYGAFEEAAQESPDALARVGLQFRDTVLARGGGQHPEQVFEAFRGRKPSMESLLTQYGLVDK